MSRVSTSNIRHWFTLLMLVLLVSSVVVWFVRWDRLPRTIRIATGEGGGLYHSLGESLQVSLRERTGRDVAVQSTRGSEENFRLLQSGDVDLAIVQAGAVPIQDVTVITPLFPEYLFVIVRKGSTIRSVLDLAEKSVSLGPSGSGNRTSALDLLAHYGLSLKDVQASEAYFKTLLDDDKLEAAIVTAGIGHPDLRSMLATNQFELIPISSAPAIDLVHPFLKSVQIPRGLFAEQPAVPIETMDTISTIAFLVALPDAPDRLIEAALQSIHEESLRLEIPTLVSRQEAPAWISTRMHPVAQRYFNPTDDIGFMANVMESLAAAKELMFAAGAGIYLLWLRWKRLKEKETEEMISQQKEHLDLFLAETLRVEESVGQNSTVEQLQRYLDQITRIKLRALHEFTEEELRGDQSFSIFLDQCSSLMAKLQLQILAQNTPRKHESSDHE